MVRDIPQTLKAVKRERFPIAETASVNFPRADRAMDHAERQVGRSEGTAGPRLTSPCSADYLSYRPLSCRAIEYHTGAVGGTSH